MEPAITASKEVGSEGGSAARLKMRSEEIVKIHEKLKEDEKEMDSISASLQKVMCESEPDKVGNRVTQDMAIEKLEEDVEGHLEKHKKLLEDNEEVITAAIERSLQVITF